MSEVSIFNEIIAHKIVGVMLHDDLADLFDFLSLHGYKREHEYHALCEFAEMRGLSRYMINHINHLPDIDNLVRGREVIPTSWKSASATRYAVSDSDRKMKVKEAFTKWVEYEKETKELFQRKFQELSQMGYIACANKVNELIQDIDCELKYAERQLLELSAISWDMNYICQKQDEIHETYKRLTEEEIKIKMC